MNSLVFIFAVGLAVAHASFIPSTKILEGPSSRTTVIGADGSAIHSFAPGGRIITDDSLAIAETPLIARSFVAPAAVPAAWDSTVVAGPSGTIATTNTEGFVARSGYFGNEFLGRSVVAPYGGLYPYGAYPFRAFW